MELVEDYLRAVAVLLAKDKRDDIVEELRELILSRIESREDDLGRALKEEEIEDVLRELGHPLVVASRYDDGPNHLVGPTLYPFWIFAVKAAVALQLAVAVIVFLLRALTGDFTRALGQAVASGFTGSMVLVGVATALAWLIERKVVRIGYFDRWRVRDLGFLGVAALDADAWRAWLTSHRDGFRPNFHGRSPSGGGAAPGSSPSEARSRSDASQDGRRGGARAFNAPSPQRDDARRYNYRYAYRGDSPVARGLMGIAAGMVLLLWWIGFIHFGIVGGADDFRSLGVEPGLLAKADWAAVKRGLYAPVLAYIALIVMQGAVRIANPEARRLDGLFDIAVAAVVMAALTWLWTLSPIASTVRVATAAQFVRDGRTLLENGPPFPLAPALNLALACIALGAVVRAMKGVAVLAMGTSRPPTRGAQAAPTGAQDAIR